jgi:hypothetical protein
MNIHLRRRLPNKPNRQPNNRKQESANQESHTTPQTPKIQPPSKRLRKQRSIYHLPDSFNDSKESVQPTDFIGMHEGGNERTSGGGEPGTTSEDNSAYSTSQSR